MITYMGTTWEGGIYSSTIEDFFPEYDDWSVPIQGTVKQRVQVIEQEAIPNSIDLSTSKLRR